MVEGGMKCVKYLLFVFNLIFFIAGACLMGVGGYVLAQLKDFNDILGSQYGGLGVLFIVVGVIIFIVGFLGCCGAYKENYCMTMTFAVLMTIIFILEIAGGIAGFALRNQLEDEVGKTLKTLENKYKNDKAARDTFDNLQKEIECCGVNNYTEWNNTFPKSCCIKPKEVNCEKAQNGTLPAGEIKKTIFDEGCKDGLIQWVKDRIVIIGAVGIVLALIQIVGIIFSCCLARSIKKEYEVV